MLQNYLKIGIRNLLHHQTYSLINIVGLAAGISCCLFIVLYINDELTFDRYHENAERICRISMEGSARTPAAVGPAMMASYPHLTEEVVRLWPLFAPAKMRRGDVTFVETRGVFADQAVFSVFTWAMLAGNPASALAAPQSVVLTESMARKYFGKNDPVGEIIEFWGEDMTITGVVEDVPLNSHIQFDFLISFHTLSDVMGGDLDQNWGMPAFYTYALAAKGISSNDIANAVKKMFSIHKAGGASEPVLTAMTRIHLHSKSDDELSPAGNIEYLYTLGAAAVIVLLLACINFTNLATARAATRTKEVGVRKVMGAMRGQLIGQFFGEAMMMTVAAFAVAVILVNLALPFFNHLAGKAIELKTITSPAMLLALLVMMMLIGLVAGAYPALYLSKFKPASVLKGMGNLRASRLFIRKGLIVFQFTLSTVFLIGMTVVLLQLHFLQSKDLGFDSGQVIVLDGDNFPQMRDALQGVAGVEYVAGVPQMLGGPLPMSPYRLGAVTTDSLSQMRHYGVTPEFVETMGMHLVAGRTFMEGSLTDRADGFIVNESATRELGWRDATEAIGKAFAMLVPPINGGEEVWREGTIIGVVRDFNYDALYKQIGPVVLYPCYDLNLAFVRVRQINSQVLAGIRSVWDKVNPDAPFNYYFLDDRLKQQYEAEVKLGKFVGAATALAVLIACLGLFGLVAFSAGQRTKEIGIRKVLGATVGQIVALLSGDFLKLVCLAVVLAIPIAHIAMSRWLDNFAYHISLSWLIFAGAGLLVMLIAVIAVSSQSVHAAKADPIESMRYE